LQSHNHLRECVRYCTDCGIRFLTHPRNVRRKNLRCPFGCRKHHRRQRSNERSRAYYQTPAGKKAKHLLNLRRERKPSSLDRQGPQGLGQPGTSPDEQLPVGVEQRPGEVPGQAGEVEQKPGEVQAGNVQQKPGEVPGQAGEVQEKFKLELGGVVLDEPALRTSPMLPYVRMIVNLIEGQKLGCAQFVSLLLEVWRQRRIGGRRRIDYVLGFLHQHPPEETWDERKRGTVDLGPAV